MMVSFVVHANSVRMRRITHHQEPSIVTCSIVVSCRTAMGESEEDTEGYVVEDDLGQMLREAEESCETEKKSRDLKRMLEDYRILLYLIANKAKRSWVPHKNCCNGRHQMVCLTRDSRSNTLPETTYEAKKVVCPLGLEAQKIHACPNDYILYCGEENENLDACPVCSACRYKIPRDDPGNLEGIRIKKRVPDKMIWYFPLIPRLKRLFMYQMNAKLMRWHKEDRKQDNMLRHPTDGSQ